MSTPVVIGLLVVLVAATFLLAGAEALLAHVTRARAATWADEGAPGAARLVTLLQRRQTHLGAVTVVRVTVEVAGIGVAVEAAGDALVPALVASAATFALVEAGAKVAALARADKSMRRSVAVLDVVVRLPLLVPIGELATKVVRRPGPDTAVDETRPTVSEEELLAFADVAVAAEAIEEEEGALIASIISFGDTIVREVMVPRPDMISVEATFQVSDVMEILILNGLSRLPVTGAGIDDVIGISYVKDLMRAERDGRGTHPVADHLRSARFVPEQQLVSTLLREMQAEQFHMAVVVDEYGGVAGLVTLEDLIEELVGEIVDEYDVEEPMAEVLPSGAYRVNARMALHEVNDLIAADLPEGDWDTIGGLLFAVFGHVPTNGESIEMGSHRLTASRVQGRRIRLVRIEALEEPADDEARDGAA